MPFLRYIDTTWGDQQVLGPSALNTVHEPCVEIVMPVPTVLVVAWQLEVISNPSGIAVNLLGNFRFEVGCGRARIQQNVPVAVGTTGNSMQMPLQSIRALWVTGNTVGAELATVAVSVLAAPLTPPGPSFNEAAKWLVPPGEVQRPGINANLYSGGNIDPWNPLQPLYSYDPFESDEG